MHAMTSPEIQMQDCKRRLRREIRDLLAGFQRIERQAASAEIVKLVAGLDAWQSAANVLAYAPMPDEPDITPLLAAFPGTVHLPVVSNNEVTIRPLRADAALVPGERGNLEPETDEYSQLDSIDLALVPGRAFTQSGIRLGRGGGHYDRMLAKLSGDCLLIGVGFSLQVIDEIPRQPHDVLMHAVVTQGGLTSGHQSFRVD